MRTIYIVEDDDNICELITYALNTAGFEAHGFAEAGAFDAALEKSLPALVILDIMLPGEDGISILKRLKSSDKTRMLPVIILTAKSAEYERVHGLDLGADDYITKPFSVLELISRIKAVLRRCQVYSESSAVLSLAALTLDQNKRRVQVYGVEVPLTYKEFELLSYLMRNEGIALSRNKLMEQVWGFDYEGESRTVDMHIKSLRKKLGALGENIKTVRGVGYKIEG